MPHLLVISVPISFPVPVSVPVFSCFPATQLTNDVFIVMAAALLYSVATVVRAMVLAAHLLDGVLAIQAGLQAILLAV